MFQAADMAVSTMSNCLKHITGPHFMWNKYLRMYTFTFSYRPATVRVWHEPGNFWKFLTYFFKLQKWSDFHTLHEDYDNDTGR